MLSQYNPKTARLSPDYTFAIRELGERSGDKTNLNIVLSCPRSCVNLCHIAKLYLGSSGCSVSVLGCGFPLQLQATQDFGQDSLCPHHQCGIHCGDPSPPLSHPPEGRAGRTQESSHCLLWTKFGLQHLSICPSTECGLNLTIMLCFLVLTFWTILKVPSQLGVAM